MANSDHSRKLRDAIVTTIRKTFPVRTVPTVRAYDGKFDPKSLQRNSIRTPAILVTVLGGTSVVRGSTVYDELAVGLYVLAQDSLAECRTAMALMLRERLAQMLPFADFVAGGHKFGLLKGPPQIEWQNRYDGTLEEMGVTLWLGAWHHTLELPALEPADYDNLADFARLWSEIFNPGEVEAAPETGNALTEQQVDIEVSP